MHNIDIHPDLLGDLPEDNWAARLLDTTEQKVDASTVDERWLFDSPWIWNDSFRMWFVHNEAAFSADTMNMMKKFFNNEVIFSLGTIKNFIFMDKLTDMTLDEDVRSVVKKRVEKFVSEDLGVLFHFNHIENLKYVQCKFSVIIGMRTKFFKKWRYPVNMEPQIDSVVTCRLLTDTRFNVQCMAGVKNGTTRESKLELRNGFSVTWESPKDNQFYFKCAMRFENKIEPQRIINPVFKLTFDCEL